MNDELLTAWDELILPEPKENEVAELIKSLHEGSYTLSFSSLAAFTVSPKHFIAYKVNERKETEAMLRGRVLHAHVLEPDRISQMFIQLPEANATTVEGKKTLAAWAEAAYDLHYPVNKLGNPQLPKMEDFKAEIKAKAGLDVVSEKTWSEAKKAASAVLKNRAARAILDRVTATEVKSSTDVSGIRFKGIIDAQGERLIADLKQVPDASLERGTGTFWARKIAWQLAGYNRAIVGDSDCYAIMVDPRGEVLTIQCSASTMIKAERQLVKTVDIFKEAVLESMFDPSIWQMSQDFWLRSEMNTHGHQVV